MVVLILSCALLWSSVISALHNPALIFRMSEPVKLSVDADSVNVTEGKKLKISCEYSGKPSSPAIAMWSKPGSTNFYKRRIVLEMSNLHRKEAGDYICEYGEYSRILTMYILYPPTEVRIDGPYKIMKKESLNLTCSADSVPASHYWWTSDPSYDAPILSKGAIFNKEIIEEDDIWLYCFAQNTMMPTGGQLLKSKSVSHLRHVTAYEQEHVHIRELPLHYTAYIGSTLDIECNVDGVPDPKVWWTKLSDNKFTVNGSRLVAVNVQPEFAGIYFCNARNSIELATGKRQKRDVFKKIDVKIIEIPKTDNTRTVWVIVATMSGLNIIIVALTAVLLCRFKRKCKARSHYTKVKEPAIELPTIFRSKSGTDRYCSTEQTYDHTSRPKPTGECQNVDVLPGTCNSILTEETTRKQLLTPDFSAIGIYERI